MTAIEQVECLKAARRAELKAAEDERKHAEELRAEAADRAFFDSLCNWLREQNAEWLLDFHTRDERPHDTERAAVFAIPGHASIKVTFHGSAHDGFRPVAYSAGFWWVNNTGYMRLDDALIVAEASHDIPL